MNQVQLQVQHLLYRYRGPAHLQLLPGDGEGLQLADDLLHDPHVHHLRQGVRQAARGLYMGSLGFGSC